MILIPVIKKLKSKEGQVDTFEAIEGSFSGFDKAASVLTALSSFI